MRRLFLSLILAIALLASWNAPSFAGFFFPGITSENFWGQIYDPTTIAAPTVWYKSTGVTLDTTLGQNTVASWTNAGGGGSAYNWTQATKTRQPVYLTGQAYGYPALQFDGVDDFLSGSGGGLALCKNASSCTLFVVMDWQSTGATQDLLTLQAPSPYRQRFEAYANNSAGAMVLGVGAVALDADTSSALTESAPYQSAGLRLVQWQVDYANKQGASWNNATNEFGPSTLTNMTAGNTSNTNANAITFGGYNGATNPLYGKVYEVMLFENKVLTAYERSHIQNYFRYKYGIW